MTFTKLQFLSILLLLLLTTPPSTAHPHLLPRSQDPITILLTIAPTSSTCSSTPFPNECSTASTAAPCFISSFTTYSITTAAEQAALLAWTAYESLEWKVQHNLSPGISGQGTYTMMQPPFISEYISSIPTLSPQAAQMTDDPAAVLALVTGPGNAQYSFGSAAWFYGTQCSESVKTALRSGTQSGWEGFLTGCVGTVADEGEGSTSRLAYWQRATAALGVVTA